jgi:hypothetical protein
MNKMLLPFAAAFLLWFSRAMAAEIPTGDTFKDDKGLSFSKPSSWEFTDLEHLKSKILSSELKNGDPMKVSNNQLAVLVKRNIALKSKPSVEVYRYPANGRKPLAHLEMQVRANEKRLAGFVLALKPTPGNVGGADGAHMEFFDEERGAGTQSKLGFVRTWEVVHGDLIYQFNFNCGAQQKDFFAPDFQKILDSVKFE